MTEEFISGFVSRVEGKKELIVRSTQNLKTPKKLIKKVKKSKPNAPKTQELLYFMVARSLIILKDSYNYQDIVDTYTKKQQDYGSNFMEIRKLYLISYKIRLLDKLYREEQLMSKKSLPNYETLEDTHKDIIGYCLLELLAIEQNKGVRNDY